MKILIMGLPGSGKTTLAEALAKELQCVMVNADDVRKNINKDLGFTIADRIEQAKRMGHLCDVVGKWGAHVIADFVCPIPECRIAFNANYVIWVDRIQEGRFEDTNRIFVPPEEWDMRITANYDHCFPAYHAQELKRIINNHSKISIPAVRVVQE